MGERAPVLWPYGTRAAMVATVALWFLLMLVVTWLRTCFGWTDTGAGAILMAILVAGLLPSALRIIDHLVQIRAIVDVRGVKFDFSQPGAIRQAIALPDNIGRADPVVADSQPMQILAALQSAEAHDVVRIDLHDGGAWWVTRLLALVTGADQAGRPRVIVFSGTKEDRGGVFLGWATVSTLLRALLADPRAHPPSQVTYGQIVRKATWLSRQLALEAAPVIPPPTAMIVPPGQAPVPPSAEVARYAMHPDYRELGEEALGQVVLDLCAQYELEKPPDRLTYARLEDLFGHCLRRGTIDLDLPQEGQFVTVFGRSEEYVALVRAGIYESMLQVDVLQSQVLRQLLSRPSADE